MAQREPKATASDYRRAVIESQNRRKNCSCRDQLERCRNCSVNTILEERIPGLRGKL